MAMASIPTLMALSTKATGKEAIRRAKESLLSQTVTIFLASGIYRHEKDEEVGKVGMSKEYKKTTILKVL